MKADKLEIKIYETRDEMGQVAADDIAAAIKGLLAEKEEINFISLRLSPTLSFSAAVLNVSLFM